MSLAVAPHDFMTFTDHRPLTTICNKRRLDDVKNTCILQSLVKLMDYNFTVEYLPGVENRIADTLSRHPADTPTRTARLVQAEAADYFFRLQQIQDAAEEDLKY